MVAGSSKSTKSYRKITIFHFQHSLRVFQRTITHIRGNLFCSLLPISCQLRTEIASLKARNGAQCCSASCHPVSRSREGGGTMIWFQCVPSHVISLATQTCTLLAVTRCAALYTDCGCGCGCETREGKATRYVLAGKCRQTFYCFIDSSVQHTAIAINLGCMLQRCSSCVPNPLPPVCSTALRIYCSNLIFIPPPFSVTSATSSLPCVGIVHRTVAVHMAVTLR